MTTQTAPKAQWLLLAVVMLLALSGLCTIFASVVTAAEAWQEHAEARWPEVTAHIDKCALEQSGIRRRQLYSIHCRLIYEIGAEENRASVYSASAPSRADWQYPPNQIGPLEDWVEQHPKGTPIAVRYNPARHAKVVLVANDMPRGGMRTASNVKQVEFWAGSFVVLLAIKRVKWPRPAISGRSAPVPLKT